MNRTYVHMAVVRRSLFNEEKLTLELDAMVLRVDIKGKCLQKVKGK